MTDEEISALTTERDGLNAQVANLTSDLAVAISARDQFKKGFDIQTKAHAAAVAVNASLRERLKLSPTDQPPLAA
jgi:hypothetical protein